MTPEDTAQWLEETTATARGVLAELRSELKEARRVRDSLDAAVEGARAKVAGVIDEEIGAEIAAGLERYHGKVRDSIASAEERVLDTMQRFANLAMYGNEQGRGPNIFDELRASLDGDRVPPGPVSRRARTIGRGRESGVS